MRAGGPRCQGWLPGESRRRLLVVDDHHEVREAMAAVLRDDGYEVDTASDCETARTKAGQGRFDLIVLDLMLPDADGLLLCSEFSRARLPVLACSATSKGDRLRGTHRVAADSRS